MEDIQALFEEIRSTSPKVKKLTRLSNLGKFAVPYTISRVEIPDVPYDTRSLIRIMSKDIAERLDLTT